MKLLVVKGCPKLSIKKNDLLFVEGEPKHTANGVYSVAFNINRTDRKRTLWGKLINREEFNLNNGDPTIKIRVLRIKES